MRSFLTIVTLSITGATVPAYAAWQANNDGQGFISAQVCTPNSTRCVRLQCLAMQGGGVHWYVDAPEPSYSPESTNVTWDIDGRRFTLPMTKAGPAENRTQSYEAAFDASSHRPLVERLKAGNRLTVGSDQFPSFTVSLRGSGNALTQTLSACPLTDAGLEPATATPINEPFDAVMAMMTGQSCMATESQIFDAITNAGFGIWDANQFIALGAENGTLQLIEKTDGEHRYRLRSCDPIAQTHPQSPVAGNSSYPDVIIPALDEFASVCNVANRDDVFVPDALASKDINGDGKPDHILDFQKLSCGGGLNMFCGAQMCEFAVFVSSDDGYVSDRFLGYGAHFGDDTVLMPCPGSNRYAAIHLNDGRLTQSACLEISGAAESPDAIAVDPDATALNLARDQMPRPVREKLTAIAAVCGTDFQTAEGRDQNAFLAEDINADGTYDFLLDHALFCPARTKALCEPSGCPYSLVVSGNGGWQTFEFMASGYKGFTTEGFLLTCSAEADKAGVFMEDGKLIRRGCP